MLSNRMTANSRELKPASQASARTRKTMRLLEPTGFNMTEVRDTDSMALGSSLAGRQVNKRRPWGSQKVNWTICKVNNAYMFLNILSENNKIFKKVLHIADFSDRFRLRLRNTGNVANMNRSLIIFFKLWALLVFKAYLQNWTINASSGPNILQFARNDSYDSSATTGAFGNQKFKIWQFTQTRSNGGMAIFVTEKRC